MTHYVLLTSCCCQRSSNMQVVMPMTEACWMTILACTCCYPLPRRLDTVPPSFWFSVALGSLHMQSAPQECSKGLTFVPKVDWQQSPPSHWQYSRLFRASHHVSPMNSCQQMGFLNLINIDRPPFFHYNSQWWYVCCVCVWGGYSLRCWPRGNSVLLSLFFQTLFLIFLTVNT